MADRDQSARAEAATFEEYVRERSVALQRFAWLVTHDRDEAQDAVQDALIGLYPRFERVRAMGGVDAYVHRSIVNAAISRWRKRRHTTPVEAPEDLVAARASDIAEGVADADAAWRLCAQLPPDQRAAVVLRFWGDRSFAEIAETLDCAEATARSYVHRALTRLRTRLVEEDHD